MGSDFTDAADDQSKVLYQWSARKLHPIVLLCVAAIFVAMMALAYFVVHSTMAVKSLAIAAVAAIVPLVPAVLTRIEYRLTERKLEKRPLADTKPKPFESVFRFVELDHAVPVRRGFKYFKVLDEPNPIRRFWKAHVLDGFSGEVHVEAADLQRVLGLLAEYGVRTTSAKKDSSAP